MTAASLLFDAVEQKRRVWANGDFVGVQDIGPEGWDVLYRMNVTGALRWGEGNRITVRARNTQAAGAIRRPVALL